MSIVRSIRWRPGRLRALVGKFGWGLRVVGPAATVAGLARYVGIRLRRSSPVVLPVRSGGELEVDVPAQLITTLAVFGDLIDPEYDFLRRVMRRDAVVIDVGAGVGQFTVFAAMNGAATVHAVEPDDRNLAVLDRNLGRNHVSGSVVLHRLALGQRVGAASLVVPAGVTAPAFNGRIAPVGSVGGSVDGDVPVRRLDGWVSDLGLDRVDVLKVNVAGDERDVLAGGWELFEQHRVDLLVVLLGVEVVDTLERLAGLGYRFFYHHPRDAGLEECRSFDGRFLARRPSSARHVLGASEPAVAGGLLDSFGSTVRVRS